MIRRIGRYFKRHWFAIIVSLVCTAVVGGAAGATAWIVKPVLDDIFIARDLEMLKLLPVGLVTLFLVKGICSYLQVYLMHKVGESVILQLRNDLMRRIQFRELSYFDANPTGELISRVTYDVSAMHRTIPDLIMLVRHFVTVIGLGFVLFTSSWKLALTGMVAFPLAIWPIRRASVLLRRYGKRSQEQMGGISKVLMEAFSGIEVIKAFGAEESEVERFEVEGQRLLNVRLKRARIDGASSPFMEFLGALGGAVVIWFGGREVIQGNMTPGAFFSFLTALFMLYDPIKKATRLNTKIQEALAAAERYFGLLEEPLADCETLGDVPVPDRIDEVRFSSVVFAYEEEREQVLSGIDFAAKQGEMVALVGESGAGKSTILKLLPRFYAPQSGVIAINGTDINDYEVESLRDNMAIVTQETFLFDDTVYNNLLMGRTGATRDEVIAAARAANAHNFIEELPDGYETRVGERGDLLSGGQKQRVAIARAILRDAPILILDEATSSLDSESERDIQAALAKLMKGRTTFVIAHRLSTVRHADQILLLKAGKVHEKGRHDELISRGGEYARVCKIQFGEA